MTTNGASSSPWPGSIVPDQTQKFLQRFFTLLDADDASKAEDYGQLFAEDASYYVSGISEIQGRKALQDQRAWAWKAWPGLRHEIKRLYKADEEGLDIVAVGKFAIRDGDGKMVGGGSAANFKLVKIDGDLFIQGLEIFSDPSPLTKLLSSA